MFNKVAIIKFAVQGIASVGVSKVVKDIIKNNTNIETPADAVRVWAGMIVLGALIADPARKLVDQKFDAVLKAFHETGDQYREQKAKIETERGYREQKDTTPDA